MITISSLAPVLADRLRDIYDELATCTDEVKRQSLIAERDTKRDVLTRMLDVAYTVPRRRAIES